MRKEKWLELLKNGEAFCYIKPNRHIHDSGWRCFEIGYITVGEDNKVNDKLILGEYTDHLQPVDILDNKKFMINIDLTKDGFIRFHSPHSIWWGSMNYVVSSAILTRIDFKL